MKKNLGKDMCGYYNQIKQRPMTSRVTFAFLLLFLCYVCFCQVSTIFLAFILSQQSEPINKEIGHSTRH